MLVLLGAFWPGNDSAGPNQSFKGLATALSSEFEFRVMARDRPFGAAQSSLVPGDEPDTWIDCGFAKFLYLAANRAGVSGLARALRSTPYDLLMMNGFFDREFTLPTLVWRKLGRIPRKPVILSTRGEFAGGALGLKAGRKTLLLNAAQRLGLHCDVYLHATSADEAADITRGYPHARGILVAPNVRQLQPLPVVGTTRQPGAALRLAFVGRISPVKNLDYALRVLKNVRIPVAYDIFGPVQDTAHWRECQEIIASLPENVCVTFKGEVANERIVETLAHYDALFLPTKGENFGHAIMDAFEAGVPAIISDQTPFRGLEKLKAGFDLPLASPGAFARAITDYAALTNAEHVQWRRSARALAERHILDSGAVNTNRRMLEQVLLGEKWKV